MTMSARDWRRLGLDVVRVVTLSRHGSGRAFRLDLRDGRMVKARVFPGARWAADVERLLAAPGARACPRPIERHGNILIAEFVVGTPLDEHLASATRAEARRRARDAGRLMAGLHGGRAPAGLAPPPDWYQQQMVTVARTLVRMGLLESHMGRRLIDLGAPPRARSGLTHGDICPENLILTPRGSLVAIDLERLALRPLAYDLARSINRWPLDASLERAFLEGYAASGGNASGFLRWRRFWVAAALATSAGYRLKRAPETLGPIVAAIRRVARAR